MERYERCKDTAHRWRAKRHSRERDQSSSSSLALSFTVVCCSDLRTCTLLFIDKHFHQADISLPSSDILLKPHVCHMNTKPAGRSSAVILNVWSNGRTTYPNSNFIDERLAWSTMTPSQLASKTTHQNKEYQFPLGCKSLKLLWKSLSFLEFFFRLRFGL
jgi:hypothetical protein